MVSDYNSNYSHGPDVDYPERRRRKSARKKRKLFFLIIIVAIIAAAVIIVSCAMLPAKPPVDEDLSWFYEQQKQQQQQEKQEQQKIADTSSRVYDLSNPSAEMNPVKSVIDGSEVKLLYNNNLKFGYNPDYEDPYYIKLSNSVPVTKIVIEYAVPDVSFKKSVFDGYITKIADDGILVTIGEKSKVITATYPDPDAHFGITLSDENGEVIFTDGYNMKGSASNKKQVWSLYAGGDYNIELVGSEITANIKIYE